jgi:tetratricopeptide (TPR) repeat protein
MLHFSFYFRVALWLAIVMLLLPRHADASSLNISPTAQAILEQIYSGNWDTAMPEAQRLQQQLPDHPLPYLLESEAIWWRMWCASAEFKYGMTYARHRAKVPGDQRYLDLAAKVTALAETQIALRETAEMHFYAGMGEALAVRLYALRGELRNAARMGVRAREHFLRAIHLNPNLADAEFGLGLYDYYADTLSAMARVLRFFMGIPGGNKQQGIRKLEHAIADGELTPSIARFYLAINLHNYNQQYQRALELISPLAAKYPSNAIFQLARGDLFAKLGRREEAAAIYRNAASLGISDPICRVHIQELVNASLQALGLPASPGSASKSH